MGAFLTLGGVVHAWGNWNFGEFLQKLISRIWFRFDFECQTWSCKKFNTFWYDFLKRKILANFCKKLIFKLWPRFDFESQIEVVKNIFCEQFETLEICALTHNLNFLTVFLKLAFTDLMFQISVENAIFIKVHFFKLQQNYEKCQFYNFDNCSEGNQKFASLTWFF